MANQIQYRELLVILIKWEPHTRDFSRELGDQTSQYVQKYAYRDWQKTNPILLEMLETHKDSIATTLRLNKLKRDGDESRKNILYGAWLNPKH